MSVGSNTRNHGERPIWRSNTQQGLRFVLVLSFCAWLIDILALLLGGDIQLITESPRGVLASIFFVGVFGVCIGTVLGFLWALLVGRSSGGDWLKVRKEGLRSYLWKGAAEDQRARIGRLITIIVFALFFAYLSFLLSHYFILAFARPNFIALAIAAGHLGLILVLIPFFGPVERLITGANKRLSERFPVLDVSFGRWLMVLSVFVALLGSAIVYKSWATLSFLPWSVLIRIGFMLTLGVGMAAWFIEASRHGKVRWLGGITFVLWSVGGVSGAGISHSDQQARSIYEDRVLLAQYGRDIVDRITDVDGDGYPPFFGGGDCAAFDVAINPGAVDMPWNGVDEDCYGGDLTIDGFSAGQGMRSVPVPEAFPSRPNIVLITVDAFSAKHLESLGYSPGITPNLDRLAKKGILFENCFSQGPSTRLSFPAMFTSRWDSEIERELEGRHPFPLLDSNEMMAEIMRKSGYSTHAVVPSKYFSTSRWKGLHQGFDKVHEGPTKFWNPRNRPHNAHRVTDAAIKVLKKKRKKPLFLWAHYYDAHTPHRWPQGVPRRGKSTEWIYNGELEYADRHIGRLLKEVDKRLGEDTLVIVTSDHGHGFDEPRHKKRGYGHDLNTVTLHVPLIISGPRMKPRRVSSLVSTLDILPTMTNLLGVDTKVEMRGSSLVPEIFGLEGTRPQFLFHQFFLQERRWKDESPLQMVSVRTPQYNLLVDRHKGRTYFWDWQKDYFERTNLFGSKDSEIQVEEQNLRQLLSAYLYETKARLAPLRKKEVPEETKEAPDVEPKGSRPKPGSSGSTSVKPNTVVGPPLPNILRGGRPFEKPRSKGAKKR